MKKILVSMLFAMSFSAAADVAVIVHSGNSATVDKAQIARIFLGKNKTFPNGEKAVPVSTKSGSGAESEFNQKVLNKSASQLQAYWSKLVFTGKGTPPQEMGSDAEVIDLVKSNPNIIGYVDAGSVTGDVKVIASF